MPPPEKITPPAPDLPPDTAHPFHRALDLLLKHLAITQPEVRKEATELRGEVEAAAGELFGRPFEEGQASLDAGRRATRNRKPAKKADEPAGAPAA